MPDSPSKPVLHLVPHTHWEGAVFKTREQYLDMGLSIILRALALLETYPHYRFTLDQVCYIKPFLERYPEAAASLRRFVEEGRLAIVGATDVMLDVNMPGGESFVRQVLLGKTYFREALGVDVHCSWQLDTFGHHAQMPQLLRLAGFRSFWFFRGVAKWETPAEFLWEGLDGSRLPAFWLPHGYALSYGSPTTLPEFAEFMRGRYALLDAFGRNDHRVALGGADVCLPEEHLPELVQQFNALPDMPCELRLATPTEYEDAVLSPDWPVVRGELNPIFQGIYSSRIELKQWTRELEGTLTTVEKLGAVLASLGIATCDETVWRAWEPMLFNQAHDLMSGVMTDHVWDDTVRSFAFSRQLADQELESRLARYSAAVDTQGEGLALLVFNSLGWARTDVVSAGVGFADAGVTGIRLCAPDGSPVPVQVLQAERRADGTLVEAEIAFIAREVPALGHAVYRVIPLRQRPAPGDATPAPAATGILENEHLRVEVDPLTGAIKGVVAKDGAWQALREPGNIVVQEADHGDLWEPYRPLDGGSRIAMTTPHPIAPRGQAVYSDEQSAATGTLISGPVLQEFSVVHPFGERGQFQTRVRLYAGLRRIEIRTEIVNHDEFVRYRAVFPTTVSAGQVVHEIPFGASTRPEGIEFPAQNWADWSDGQHGVALLNRGLPGNATSAGALVLSLCRSTRIVAYGFGGGYEPGMSSDTGLERGKRLTFDYALAPHAGDWRAAGVPRAGQEFNQPLIARTAAAHAGRLPPRWGLLEIEPRNLVLSALKPGQEGTIVLRVYEAMGQATVMQLRLPAGVQAVEEVNLVEDQIGPVAINAGVVQQELRAFEVKTLRLTFAPAAACCRG
jgi:alpha-mannosidase